MFFTVATIQSLFRSRLLQFVCWLTRQMCGDNKHILIPNDTMTDCILAEGKQTAFVPVISLVSVSEGCALMKVVFFFVCVCLCCIHTAISFFLFSYKCSWGNVLTNVRVIEGEFTGRVFFCVFLCGL